MRSSNRLGTLTVPRPGPSMRPLPSTEFCSCTNYCVTQYYAPVSLYHCSYYSPLVGLISILSDLISSHLCQLTSATLGPTPPNLLFSSLQLQLRNFLFLPSSFVSCLFPSVAPSSSRKKLLIPSHRGKLSSRHLNSLSDRGLISIEPFCRCYDVQVCRWLGSLPA